MSMFNDILRGYAEAISRINRGEQAMAYDIKTLELAEHFLKDKETPDEETYQKLCHQLAGEIQVAIEAWFHEQESKP